MPAHHKRRPVQVGLSPGTPVHTGEQKVEQTTITVLDYCEAQLSERQLTVDQCSQFRTPGTISWINVDGLHDVPVLERIAECFALHPLVLEDILDTNQRPKLEDYGDYLYIVVKMLTYDEGAKRLGTEQISFVVGEGYVLSFQEAGGDVLDPVRQRIRTAKGKIRRMGADYLVYALLDAIVDSHFVVLEQLGELVEDIEDAVVLTPGPEMLQSIHELKRDMVRVRRSVWPLREVVAALERGDCQLVQDATRIFLRDLYDHTVQVIETVESLRDVLSGMLDIYLSSISNRMNEVMKVLTIIGTIFIPLTFVAGIYGMNFKRMPELDTAWGYPMFWGICLATTGFMLWFFRRKRWL